LLILMQIWCAWNEADLATRYSSVGFLMRM
jgi:hypothetical protein